MVFLIKVAMRPIFAWIFILLLSFLYCFYLPQKIIVKADTITQTPSFDTYTPMGPVYATAVAGETVYVGGDFLEVCYNSHGALLADGTTAKVDMTFPRITVGYVYASISDGSGGLYLGGSFSIEGTTNTNLVHVRADKTIDTAWNPAPDDIVYGLLLSGDTLYVGGAFHNIGGQVRNHIGAVDVSEGSTGSATAWDPNASTWVYTMALSGTTLYVGGQFTSIGGQTRNRIAALDTTVNTNNATTWNPNATNGWVQSIVLSGTTLYVGGRFTNIGGQARNRIAALDTTTDTNNATAWDPNASSWVHTIYLDGTILYVGGFFNTIGGQTRNQIAALDTTINTNNATGWDPNADDTVRSIYISGSTIFLGGDFSTVGTTERMYIAAVSKIDGSVLDWYPGGFSDSWKDIDTIINFGSDIFIGGWVEYSACFTRNNAAAFDTVTGELKDWDPNIAAAGSVNSLSVDGSDVYIGGTFATVDEQAITNFAVVDATTGAVDTSFNPNPDNTVRAIAYDSSNIYVGGDFLNIDSQAITYLAAISKSSGEVNATFNPNADGSVYSILVNGSAIYVGGQFGNIGGQERLSLALLNTDAVASSWNPSVYGGLTPAVYTMALKDSTIYFGGNFWYVGETAERYFAAAIDSGGNPTDWNPDPDWDVYSLVIDNSTVYLGGRFSTLKDTTTQITRYYLAAVDTSTDANVLDWDPNLDDEVYSLSFSGSTLYAGGYIDAIGGVTWPNFAQFGDGVAGAEPTPTPTLTPTPTPTSIVYVSEGSSHRPTTANFSPVCDAPSSAPILFEIKRTGNSATLYFVPAGEPVSTYHISYGRTPAADQYAVSFERPYTGAVISYKIHGLPKRETFYFKVQGLSSCNASTPWSGTVEGQDEQVLPTPTIGLTPTTIPIITPTLVPENFEITPAISPIEPQEEDEEVPGSDLVDEITAKLPEILESLGSREMVQGAAMIASYTTEGTAILTSSLVAATVLTTTLVNIETISVAVSLAQAPLKIPFTIKLFSSMREIFAGIFFPLFGFLRKRQKTLGIVIDSLTGKPIPSTYLVLFSPSGNLLTTTSNRDGRFFFSKVKPDTYKLRAEYSGYKYPSEILKVNQSTSFTHIYQGEDLIFNEELPFSNLAIPMDPKKSISIFQMIDSKFRTLLSYIFVRYFYSISLIFFGLAMFAYFINKSNLQLVAAIISFMFIIFNILKDLSLRKNTGLIVNELNQPLANQNVELYRDGEFYSSTVSDSKGRFLFAPEEGDYLLRIGKFEKQINISEVHPWVNEKIMVDV